MWECAAVLFSRELPLTSESWTGFMPPDAPLAAMLCTCFQVAGFDLPEGGSDGAQVMRRDKLTELFASRPVRGDLCVQFRMPIRLLSCNVKIYVVL